MIENSIRPSASIQHGTSSLHILHEIRECTGKLDRMSFEVLKANNKKNNNTPNEKPLCKYTMPCIRVAVQMN